MRILEQGLALLFIGIIVGLVVTNPGGVQAVGSALANFATGTVGAFASGFAGRT